MDFPCLGFKIPVACQILLLILFHSRCCTANKLLDYERIDYYKSSKAVVSGQKVNISVYYEAVNRSCASFFLRNLSPIFDNGLIDIVNLRLVPSVNTARVNLSTNTTICRDGSNECELNSLQACSINVYPDVNKHFALIYCFEFLVIERSSRKWKTCFNSLDLPLEPVLECLNSTNGIQFVQNYASETAKLMPSHKFVPWVVVNNNQSIGNDYRNFTFYACKAYKGTSLPMACQIP